MIPFSTWSKARHDAEIARGQGEAIVPDSTLTHEAEVELTNLMADMVDCLMTASVVQLRSAIQDAGKQWADQQSVRQELLLSREMEKLEEKVISSVTDVLIPVLTDLQLRRVMKEFAATLQKLLPEFGGQSLLIKAPENIHVMLNETLQSQNIVADIECSKDSDVTISGSQVVLVAGLEAWSQKLKEVAMQ